MNPQETAKQYIQLGLDPIPLHAGSKQPIHKSWQKRDVRDLWKGIDYPVNVGIRLGNGLICLDADDEVTASYFFDLFSDHDNCVVETKNGYHFYFYCDLPDDHQTYYRLGKGLDGEVRIKGCQVVAPPSYVEADRYKDTTKGWEYTFYEGSFHSIPTLHKQVIDDLLSSYTNKFREEASPPPLPSEIVDYGRIGIPLYYRDWKKGRMGKILLDKLEWLSTATRGSSYKSGNVRYPSRSEVFISVVRQLILLGRSKSEVWRIIYEYGAIPHKDPEYYLGWSYDKAMNHVMSNYLVRQIHRMFLVDYGYKTDNLVMRAILSTAAQFMRREVFLTNMELRSITGIRDYRSIENSLDRLEEAGWVERPEKYRYKICTRNGGNRGVSIPRKVGTYLGDLHTTLNASYSLGKHSLPVLSYLLEEGGSTQTEMKEELGIPRMSLYRTMQKLHDEEIVGHRKVGRRKLYYLAEDWVMRLYDIASDHREDNEERLEEEKERLRRYIAFKKEEKRYKELKEDHGKEIALEIIKSEVAEDA